MKKKIKERVIPTKNYVILAIICIVCLLLSLYILSWYKNYKSNQERQSIIKDVVAEVTYDDLNNFLKERDIFVLYMCTADSDECLSFEKKLKEYVVDNYLTNEVVYFDISNYQDDKDFLTNFYNKYKSTDLIKKLNTYPLLFVFKEGKIVDVLSSSDSKKISITSVDNFLDEYDLKNE